MKNRLAIAGVLVGVAVLGACSSPATPEAPQVASVQTDGTSATSAPSPQGQPERPRFRIDMTDDEQKALYDGYRACMSEHGINLNDRANAGKDKARTSAAAKACDPLLPLPAWENDIGNPDAFDFNRRVVECLRAKGVKYVEVSRNEESGMVGPSFGGPQNDQESITKGLDLTPECQREVANGGFK
jgi:hypothetical protein